MLLIIVSTFIWCWFLPPAALVLRSVSKASGLCGGVRLAWERERDTEREGFIITWCFVHAYMCFVVLPAACLPFGVCPAACCNHNYVISPLSFKDAQYSYPLSAGGQVLQGIHAGLALLVKLKPVLPNILRYCISISRWTIGELAQISRIATSTSQ